MIIINVVDEVRSAVNIELEERWGEASRVGGEVYNILAKVNGGRDITPFIFTMA